MSEFDENGRRELNYDAEKERFSSFYAAKYKNGIPKDTSGKKMKDFDKYKNFFPVYLDDYDDDPVLSWDWKNTVTDAIKQDYYDPIHYWNLTE